MSKSSAQETASAKKIASSITALPPLPATAQEILTCFGDEFIDASKVADVVEGDPGICAKLLGVANSAYFGLAEPVNNIREAVSRVLGVETVRSLVLAMALQRSFNSKNCRAFDTTRFWTQALLTAECCKKLVAVDGSASDTTRDLAYSAGLCHNLGLMALAHMETDRTHAVLHANHKNPEPGNLSRLFFNEFEFDHKIMTLELARFWALPEPMVAAYHCRALPDSVSDDPLALIVAASAAVAGNMEVNEDQRTDTAHWASAFSLTPKDLQNMDVFGDRQKERVQSLAANMTG